MNNFGFINKYLSTIFRNKSLGDYYRYKGMRKFLYHELGVRERKEDSKITI